MNPAVLAATLASAIAPPQEGRFSSQPREDSHPRTASPSSPASSEDLAPRPGSGSAPLRIETPVERQERLMREGIRKRPEVKEEIPRDYLSTLKRRLDPEGQANLQPPELRFGLGFASWFPTSESSGRSSRALGAYQGFAQVWTWGAGGPEGRPCQGSRACSFQSLNVGFFAPQSETTVQGVDSAEDETVSMDILVNDLDVGVFWRRDWQRALQSSEMLSWAFACSAGILPFRQRYVERYGAAVPKEGDLGSSGPQFNPLGTMVSVSVSFIALSLFETGLVTGFTTSSPAEVKSFVGLQFSLRSPQALEPESPTSPVPAPQMENSRSPRNSDPKANNVDDSKRGAR